MNNTTTKRSAETGLLVLCALLLLLSALTTIQGFFEIADYLPHIQYDRCLMCAVYAAEVPCRLLMFFYFSVSGLAYYYSGSTAQFRFFPLFSAIYTLPGLVYDFAFISENGFTSDGEYHIAVYLTIDIILLLNTVFSMHFTVWKSKSRAALLCPVVFLAASLVYMSGVFLYYGSPQRVNYIGYHFCTNTAGIVFSLALFAVCNSIFPKQSEKISAKQKEKIKMSEKKYAALTFDDGPNCDTTLKVLSVLKKHGVRASFFLVGNNITDESKTAAKQCFEYGCELCNHSETHTAMTFLSKEEISGEISRTDGKIASISGDMPKFFRPPYIAMSDEMHGIIPHIFICGIGAEDWNDSVDADERAGRILEQAENGSIILLHDMKGNDKTVQALETIIPSLKKDGFELVTISELFSKCNVTPQKGRLYSNVLKD